MVLLYKDLSKISQDILTEDYDYSHKIKTKVRGLNGVNFTTEGIMNANNAILGKVSGGFMHEASGVVFKRLQVTTEGRLLTEAEVPNIITQGCKLTFKVEDGSVGKFSHAQQVGVVGVEYKKSQYSVHSEADFVNNGVKTGLVFKKDQFYIGGQVDYSLEKSHLTEHNIGASIIGFDYAASITTKKNMRAISASFHHHVSRHTVYAATFDYDIKTTNNLLTIGGRYKPSLTDKIYAAKIDSLGILSLAAINQITPSVSLTTNVQMDTKKFDAAHHKFGLGLTIS